MLEAQKNSDVIEQIKKLVTRIGNLSQTKLKFFDFIIKSQNMFNENSKSIKKQIENFQDTITKKSFYSIGKCKNMKRLIFIYKHLCNFIQDVAKLNIDSLGKVDINSAKLQEKLIKKSDQFIKSVAEYNQSEAEYNKKYAEYEYLCEKLGVMITKSKSFEDPISFYNLNTDSDFTKNLDKKFHQSENKELNLTSFLQFLDQKRKRLTQSLKDIKEDFVFLLHTHLTSFHNAASILADSTKDQMYNMQSILAVQDGQGDVFNQEIQRFDIKYGKQSQRQDEMFSDLKQLFNANCQDVQISSDQRLFLDRCQTFINKKGESVQQFLYLQKKMIEYIQNQIVSCQKIEKQCLGVEKSVFKSNGTEDFKKKVQKYFGEGTLNLITLCFLINDVAKRRFDKVSKSFQSHDEKLKKIVQKKQQQLKKFKKRTSQLLSQHLNASKGVQNNLVSVSQFKNNIQKTFATFKNIYDQFTRNETAMDLDFQEIIKTIIAFVKRQSEHCQLSYILKKQKEKVLYNNVFKKFNSDTQIIEIVKQDTRYEVLFNDPLRPTLLIQFKSQIEKKKYEETKKILKNKEYHTKSVVQTKQPGCCGMITSGRVNKYSKIKAFKASLYYEGVFRPGKLEIISKGISFEEKKKNLFAQKIQLVILAKDITSCCQKAITQGRNGIQVTTINGALIFETDQFQQFQESFQKNNGAKYMVKDRDNNSSRQDKSSGESSSFLKQNTSTQYKVSFEKSVLSPEIKSNLNKWNKNNNNDAVVLKQLIDKWKKQKLFSQFFIIQSIHPPSQTTGSIRIDYRFHNDVNKFVLKEKRSVKILNPSQNLIQFLYQWKVSFPQMPMLKSFTHAQDVKIQMAQSIVKIKVTQRNRGQSHLFIRKTFYNEVDKMNKNLSDFIVKTCEREGEVLIDQEPESQQSTILLDLQNLAIDKQQIQSKNGGKQFKIISSGNSQIESIRGGSSRYQGSQI